MEGQGTGGAQEVGDFRRLDERHSAEDRGGRHAHALNGLLGRKPDVERPREQGIVVVDGRGDGSYLLKSCGHSLQVHHQAGAIFVRTPAACPASVTASTFPST